MSRNEFGVTTIYASSLHELEVGDVTPSLDEYWMSPITRIVIGGSKQVEDLPTNPSGVAARDSQRFGA